MEIEWGCMCAFVRRLLRARVKHQIGCLGDKCTYFSLNHPQAKCKFRDIGVGPGMLTRPSVKEWMSHTKAKEEDNGKTRVAPGGSEMSLRAWAGALQRWP